ncbi:alcohol oxidase, partial [Neoconidiobolus thromboides FSU 785]
KVYDYIVVGAGSAGGMLAMRLANYGFTTLLLEAGSEPEPNSWNITVPAFSTRASEDPKIAWDYFVKHYKEETKLRQEVFYPRASGLGGCSLHHAQIAVYPQKRDFDLLYELTGNDIFKEPLFREKYFKPLENCNYPLQVSDKNDHGYRGWYPTSYSPLVRMLSSDKSLSKLLAFLGGDPTHDVNGYINGNVGTDSVGLFNIPSAVHQTNYTRMNYLGQLQMARAFSPLTILTDTLVSKVIFDKNKKAIGVNVYHGANLYKASPLFDDNRSRQAVPNQFFARNEVIISAGTFNTPQLLMLSGIGDKEELNKFNITTISDLKGVGKNLLDRNEIPYILKLENDLPLFKDCFFSSNEYADRCFRQYKNEKNGAYLANSGVSGEIYKSNKYLNEPDIFIINTPVYFYGYYKGYSEEAVKNTRYFNRLILKAHTRSQGYVKLKSNDPRETPDINLLKFNIGGVEDMNALITSIEYVRNRTREEVGEENVYEEVYPGKQYASRWQIAKWIAEITWGHHVCCTAKLGLDNDPMAVLDSRFRVRGVKGLRVMDMSALPDIPGFFPNLFIHMMGNVLGDFI